MMIRSGSLAGGTRSRRRGTAAIEFGLWLPVLLLFVSAVVDWGSYMTQRVAVSRGVMEGTRRGASVFEPTGITAGSQIVPQATLRTTQILLDLGIVCPAANCNLVVQYCRDGVASCSSPPFDALQITVNYQFTPFFGFIPTPAAIQEQFLMAVENQREPD